MMRRFLDHLTYANVIASIALFVALGGSGYAALKLPKSSVGNKQIKKNAVTSSKVKNRSLLAGDFKTGQVLTPGTGYTKGEADGRFLGKGETPASAGNANTLDGADSSAFVGGGGTRLSRTFSATDASPAETLSLPGYGDLTLDCSAAKNEVKFRNTTSSTEYLWFSGLKRNSGGPGTTLGPSRGTVLAGSTQEPASPAAGSADSDEQLHLELQVVPTTGGSGHVAHIEVFADHVTDSSGNATCRSSVAAMLAP